MARMDAQNSSGLPGTVAGTAFLFLLIIKDSEETLDVKHWYALNSDLQCMIKAKNSKTIFWYYLWKQAN